MFTSQMYPEYAPQLYQRDVLSISELYHENTKYHRCSTGGGASGELDMHTLQRMSQAFKSYAAAHTVPLPREFAVGSCPLEEAIQKRRSSREFSGAPLGLNDLSRLLHFANGITAVAQNQDFLQPFRAAPSAGALYPIEIYPIVLNVTDVTAGIYHYNVRNHLLELLSAGDYVETSYEVLMRQDLVKEAALLLVLTAIFPRTTSKYGERGYRFVLLDAGHIGQNVYLMATAMGLGVVSIGGFYDDDIHALLRLDGVNEAVVYIVAVGYPLDAGQGRNLECSTGNGG